MREAEPANGQAATRTTTARRFRLESPTTAGVLGGLGVVLLLALVPLSIATRDLTAGNASSAVISIVYGGAGFVVTRRQPRNAVGWLLLGFALLLAADTDGSLYAVLVYRLGHGALPFGPVAILAGQLWAPAIAISPLAILLFPDGTLPGRWRWVPRAYLIVGACWPASVYVVTVATIIGHRIGVDTGGELTIIDSPAGSRRGHLRRRSRGTLVGSLDTHPSGLAQAVSSLGGTVTIALPLSIGVGILRYRLYDIDRIISRALAYALVTGLLVGLYTGLVLLATRVLAFHSSVAVAASTLAAAALFNPLRRRVQRVVDRRFNRARYDADKTVAAFAGRLNDAVDLDAVRDDLARVVHKALEPANISVWMRER